MASVQQLRDGTLLGLFLERKAAVDKAREALDEVGAEIAARAAVVVGGVLEGSTTWVDSGYKANVIFALNRKLDVEAIKGNWANLPAAVCSAIGWKAELKMTEYRSLTPGHVELLQEYITETKPAKPAVKVVSVKPGN